MLLLDDNNAALVAAMTQNNNTADIVVPDHIKEAHDTLAGIKDSLSNMGLSDLKDVVTGENTLIKDGLHALVQLTVEFVPKLLIAIIILFISFFFFIIIIFYSSIF